MKISVIKCHSGSVLIALVIVVLLTIGCSDTTQPITLRDVDTATTSSTESSAANGDDRSSQPSVETILPDNAPGGSSIETTTTSEEVLADLLDFDRVYPNLDIKKITDIVDPSDGESRLYIATQSGIIYSIDRNQTLPEPSVFLNLKDLISTQYNEEGLLGLTFDPNFRTTREFYVYYIAPAPRRSVIARYIDDGYGLQADKSSAEILLEINQPFGNHNGGQLLFGPDGFLYIGLGDGGGANDPNGHAQNRETLLGSILRIDVRGHGHDGPYDVPETNPFFNSDKYKPEIWAYGFRNPWRFAFDTESDKLWVSDVGQELWEEVNKVVPGANYGWNVTEGSQCLTDIPGCETGKITPVWTYGREQGCSVIGGVVYTGSSVQSLNGMYLFGDYCTGTIWALKDGIGYLFVAELGHIDANITSFGSDELGEVYIGTYGGEIYRLNAIP